MVIFTFISLFAMQNTIHFIFQNFIISNCHLKISLFRYKIVKVTKFSKKQVCELKKEQFPFFMLTSLRPLWLFPYHMELSMYISFLPGPIQLSVQVIKLVSSNVSKDRSFKEYFFLEILTNFDRVTKNQATF